MRAKDMEPGDELYYTTSNNYLGSRWLGHRVVVVDPTPGDWRPVEGSPLGWEIVPSRRRSGLGRTPTVLVDQYEPTPNDPAGRNSPPRRMAVRSINLRGPWDAILAQHQAAIEERRETQRQHNQLVDERSEACQAAAAALQAVGVPAQAEDGMYAFVSVGYEHAALLRAAAQHLIDTGWRPPAQ